VINLVPKWSLGTNVLILDIIWEQVLQGEKLIWKNKIPIAPFGER